MGLIRTVDRTVYYTLRAVMLTVRIAWACTFGLIFAGFYLAAGFLMSPFGMAYGGAGKSATKTAVNICLLTPGRSR